MHLVYVVYVRIYIYICTTLHLSCRVCFMFSCYIMLISLVIVIICVSLLSPCFLLLHFLYLVVCVAGVPVFSCCLFCYYVILCGCVLCLVCWHWLFICSVILYYHVYCMFSCPCVMFVFVYVLYVYQLCCYVIMYWLFVNWLLIVPEARSCYPFRICNICTLMSLKRWQIWQVSVQRSHFSVVIVRDQDSGILSYFLRREARSDAWTVAVAEARWDELNGAYCAPGSPTDATPSPPTKSLGFGGFDSSKLLILRDGNYNVRLILQGVSRKSWLEDS